MGRWSQKYSSCSSDFTGGDRPGPGPGRRKPAPAAPDAPQDPCERGARCAGGRRNPETLEWSPAPASQHLCPACQAVLAAALAELPGAFARLALMSISPARSGRAVRVPPGSRVLANPEADALMREIADVAGGWAARVRALPQLSLSRHGYPHGSTDQVAEDCRVLGVHLQPLLALPVERMFRTWPYLPGKAPAGGKEPEPLPVVPCRRCALPVSPSPSGKHWWAAACAHPAAAPAAYTEDADGNLVPSALACRACSARLPLTWQPAPPCEHEPSRGAPAPVRKAPAPKGPRTLAEVEDEIGHLRVIRAGDGWITAETFLHGGDGACELNAALARARGLLKESPAPPDHLDGVPCRNDDCQAFGLERAPLPAGPDTGGEPPFSRCPACRDTMTRPEYQEWAAWYAAWADGADLACTRCEQKRCGECSHPGCACRAAGHAAA
jgi:hypothetical protein